MKICFQGMYVLAECLCNWSWKWFALQKKPTKQTKNTSQTLHVKFKSWIQREQCHYFAADLERGGTWAFIWSAIVHLEFVHTLSRIPLILGKAEKETLEGSHPDGNIHLKEQPHSSIIHWILACRRTWFFSSFYFVVRWKLAAAPHRSYFQT